VDAGNKIFFEVLTPFLLVRLENGFPIIVSLQSQFLFTKTFSYDDRKTDDGPVGRDAGQAVFIRQGLYNLKDELAVRPFRGGSHCVERGCTGVCGGEDAVEQQSHRAGDLGECAEAAQHHPRRQQLCSAQPVLLRRAVRHHHGGDHPTRTAAGAHHRCLQAALVKLAEERVFFRAKY